MTPELMEEYLEMFKKGDAPAIPYYSLTTQQYENLSSNVADITRYIENILSIIKYYRNLDEEKKLNENQRINRTDRWWKKSFK